MLKPISYLQNNLREGIKKTIRFDERLTLVTSALERCPIHFINTVDKPNHLIFLLSLHWSVCK